MEASELSNPDVEIDIPVKLSGKRGEPFVMVPVEKWKRIVALPEKWRKEVDSWGISKGCSTQMYHCADELEKAVGGGDVND